MISHKVVDSKVYRWDTNTLSWVVWDGALTANGPITIGIVNQGSAGVQMWKVDASGATVPVSGPLTDAQLRASSVPVSGTFFQASQPVSVSSLPLPSGASTEATLALIKTKTDNLDVLLSTRTKPADSQHVIIDSSAALAVTGPLTDAQLRASTVPISGNVGITGNVEVMNDAGNPLPVSGAVSVANMIPAVETGLAKETGGNLAAMLSVLNVPQGAAASLLAGPLTQAIVSDVPNSFTSDVVQPLSLTSDGRLRVSAVSAQIDRIWQNTFSNPWDIDSPSNADSHFAFAGETYV